MHCEDMVMLLEDIVLMHKTKECMHVLCIPCSICCVVPDSLWDVQYPHILTAVYSSSLRIVV